MVAQPIMNFILRHLGTKRIVYSKRRVGISEIQISDFVTLQLFASISN